MSTRHFPQAAQRQLRREHQEPDNADFLDADDYAEQRERQRIAEQRRTERLNRLWEDCHYATV